MTTSAAAEVTLQAVGDIGLVGRILSRIRSCEDGYPFAHVKQALSEAEILFGNLEIPVLEHEGQRTNPIVPATLVSTVEAVGRLRSAGFHVLSLANNHVLDHGALGLRTTLRALRENGLGAVGAGEDLASARRPFLLERKGIRFGFLAYTASPETWAQESRPGAAPMVDEIVEEDLRSLRARVDVVVLSLHFGLMYTDFPRLEDQARLRRWITGGADVILGHHPHVCQGIEPFGKGLIAYSLGEFVFDPRAGNVVAKAFSERRAETMVLRCRFGATGLTGWEIVPIRIGDDFAPAPADGADAQRIVQRFASFSEPLAGDGLQKLDLATHVGSRLVAHELRVLWHHFLRLHVGYLFGRVKKIRLWHLRVLWAGIRHALSYMFTRKTEGETRREPETTIPKDGEP